VGSTDLAQGFRTRLELVPAVDEPLQQASYRLRHTVYCEDLGFEPVREDRRETDLYDAHARALLMRQIGTGEFIASARLIRTPSDRTDDLLPFEVICADTLDCSMLARDPVPREAVAEASRLCVISKFRRREGEDPVPAPLAERDFGDHLFPRFPYMIIGLYLGVAAMARLEGVRRLYQLTEPRLAEHLSRLNVQVVPVGGAVQDRGMRIPSMIDVEALVANLDRFVRLMFEEVVRPLMPPAPVEEAAPPSEVRPG
jgi:N-acyl amino acid synthase of PEP-CTERM/exosortase system